MKLDLRKISPSMQKTSKILFIFGLLFLFAIPLITILPFIKVLFVLYVIALVANGVCIIRILLKTR